MGLSSSFMTSLVLSSQHYFPLVEHVLSPCSVLRIIKTVDILTGMGKNLGEASILPKRLEATCK